MAWIEIFEGTVKTGGVLSVIVTVAVAVASLPAASMEVNETVVGPKSKAAGAL